MRRSAANEIPWGYRILLEVGLHRFSLVGANGLDLFECQRLEGLNGVRQHLQVHGVVIEVVGNLALLDVPGRPELAEGLLHQGAARQLGCPDTDPRKG